MAEFTDFMENKIIDHMLRAQAYTPPSTVYVALFTSAPSDAGGGTEVSGGAYARQAVTLDAAAGGASSNSADITFPQATADWGTITHLALMDALTGGNMLMHSPLDASKTVNNGDTFKFNAGDLDVTVD
ncbi:MAG: hypothetical protein WBH01_04420 [Dehalococcoidia bacterium]